MLICDGYDSHITSDFIEFCMDNNILLMILPPHSSHLTQPLDVEVFGVLKKHMASKLEPLLHVGISCIQKVEWTAAFIEAHQQAFRAQNILNGFRGTGIHPYQPSKVLHQVSNSTPHQCSTCINPLTPSNPFNSAVMTSSSTDMDAVQTANEALKTLINSSNPIPTPAKLYFDYSTQASEHHWTQKIILEQENKEWKTVVSSRKTRMSGKRKAIDGDSLISMVEKLNDVTKVEQIT